MEYRRVLANSLERIGLPTGRMEIFCAQPNTPLETSLREIDRCDLFVGIYAYRYGSIPKNYSLSVTEMEFDHAKKKGIPMFAFFIDPKFTWPKKFIEDEPGKSLLKEFKSKIDTILVRENFTTPEDLALLVVTSLSRYILSQDGDFMTSKKVIDDDILNLSKMVIQNIDAINDMPDVKKRQVLDYIISTSDNESVLKDMFNHLARLFPDDYKIVSLVRDRMSNWSDQVVVDALFRYFEKSKDNRIPDIAFQIAIDPRRDLGQSKPFRNAYFSFLGQVGRYNHVLKLKMILEIERNEIIKGFIKRTIKEIEKRHPDRKPAIF